MSKRKSHIKSLLQAAPPSEDKKSTENQANFAAAPVSSDKKQGKVDESVARRPSGSVRAMGLALDGLSSGREIREEVQNLRDSMARDERVVELDPAKIDNAIVADRLSNGAVDDPAFAALVASIGQDGQQVPVLVRPHPEAQKRAAGWYQAAYGHRRIAAARQLQRPVKALIRDLSDEALVLAQGKENADRRDLSFIERAMFAANLMAQGFDRSTAQAALSVDKTQMSRMVQVTDLVPPRLVQAIGPAPKAGRPRWHRLAQTLADKAAGKAVIDVLAYPGFDRLDSDARFEAVFDAVDTVRAKALAKQKPAGKFKPKPRVVQDKAGKALARYAPSDRKPVFEIDKAAPAGFADHLARILPDLAEQFAAEKLAKK